MNSYHHDPPQRFWIMYIEPAGVAERHFRANSIVLLGVQSPERESGPMPRVKVAGRLGGLLAAAGVKTVTGTADATLEEVDLTARLTDRSAPPWARSRRFQAISSVCVKSAIGTEFCSCSTR